MQFRGRISNMYVDLELHPQHHKAIPSIHLKNKASDKCEENIFKIYHK